MVLLTSEAPSYPFRPARKVSLPSAADLFNSVDAGTASFMIAPSSSETPVITPKRKVTDRGSEGTKKSKSSVAGAKEPGTSSGGDARAFKGFTPPQMSRPNIVTEDSSMWSSDATLKRQRQLEAEKRRGGDEREPGSGKKGGKDLNFKQREKVRGTEGGMGGLKPLDVESCSLPAA